MDSNDFGQILYLIDNRAEVDISARFLILLGMTKRKTNR